MKQGLILVAGAMLAAGLGAWGLSAIHDNSLSSLADSAPASAAIFVGAKSSEALVAKLEDLGVACDPARDCLALPSLKAGAAGVVFPGNPHGVPDLSPENAVFIQEYAGDYNNAASYLRAQGYAVAADQNYIITATSDEALAAWKDQLIASGSMEDSPLMPSMNPFAVDRVGLVVLNIENESTKAKGSVFLKAGENGSLTAEGTLSELSHYGIKLSPEIAPGTDALAYADPEAPVSLAVASPDLLLERNEEGTAALAGSTGIDYQQLFLLSGGRFPESVKAITGESFVYGFEPSKKNSRWSFRSIGADNALLKGFATFKDLFFSGVGVKTATEDGYSEVQQGPAGGEKTLEDLQGWDEASLIADASHATVVIPGEDSTGLVFGFTANADGTASVTGTLR